MKFPKLFRVEAEQGDPGAIEAALAKLAEERSRAVAELQDLTAQRTAALLTEDDKAVTRIEAAADARHRDIERYDLIAGELQSQLITARERVRTEQEQLARQATAARLDRLAVDIERNGEKLAAALSKFGDAIRVVERIGVGSVGNSGIVEQAQALCADSPTLATMLRDRSSKCLAGKGPASFEFLDG